MKCRLIVFTVFIISNHVAAQLSGTYNIPGDYASLAFAIADLNTQGVGPGGVTLNLLSGNPETAPAGGYVIGNTGSQVLTTSSNANPVIIQGNGNTLTASALHIAGDLNDAIFKIIGADWVTLRDFVMLENPANTINIAASNNMTEWGVALLYVTTTDGAQNNTVKGNTIDLDRTYSNTFGIYSNSTHSPLAPTIAASATTPAGSNSGLKFYANMITDVNQGIVVVGPTAAADHNDGLEIGATSLNANTISNYGTSGTFSAYANLPATVNGILIRNTKNFNVSFNSVSSSNGGTTSGNLYGIYIPTFANAPAGTFTNAINNNIISIRSAVPAGTMNGILLESATASATSTLNLNNNDFNTITHTVPASGFIALISNAGSPFILNIQNNTFSNLSINTTSSVALISHNYPIPSSGSLNIQDNSIVTAFNKTGVGGTVNCMTTTTSSPSGTSAVYTNNNFSNITVTGTTNLNGLVSADGTGSSPGKTVTGNIFTNWIGGTGSITVMSISSIGAPASNISNNTITNIAGQSAITGLSIGSSFNGANTLDIFSNTVSGLVSSGTGGNVTGFTCSNSSAAVNVNDNLVHTLSSTGASSTVVGMAISGSSAALKVFSNTIHSLSGTGLTAPVVNGLTLGASSPAVYKNKIYNLLESGAASTSVNGILVSSGGSAVAVNLYNNLVADLRATASTNLNGVRGITITATTLFSTINVSHNTVYLNAVSTGVNFGTAAIFHTANAVSTTAKLNLRNNILVNLSTPAGTGKTVAFKRSTGTAGTLANYGTESNGNLFYAGAPGVNNLIYWDGTSTAMTIAAYKTGVFTAGTIAPRDANSVSETVSSVPGTFFQSFTGTDPEFLHLVGGISTQTESGGVPMESIQLDFDGNPRNNFPDVGADEFVGVVADMVGPICNYNVLPNTVCLNNPTLSAVIMDPAGVNILPGTMPRIWFKKSTNLNVLPATNDNTTDGWKYTEANITSGPFSFNIDYSLIFGGIAPGNVIQYFVVAQDNDGTPSLMINTGVFTNQPPTVALSGSAFPVSAVNSFTLLNAIQTTVTIGVGGTYPTLTGAGGFFADLNAKGLSGPTVATIISTPITETGTNALNKIFYDCDGPYTLTIKPSVAASLTGTIASGAIIAINGASNVIIDGSTSGSTDRSLTLINSSTSSAAAISINNPGVGNVVLNNTIKNCNLSTGTNAATTYGIRLMSSDHDNTTIRNNAITKCYYGIHAPASIAGGENDNLQIIGNTIGPSSAGTSSIGLYGIYVEKAFNLLIDSNEIRHNTVNGIIDFGGGIQVNQSGGYTITRNNIHDINAAMSRERVIGISLGTIIGNTHVHTISHNTIRTITQSNSAPEATSGAYGIFISSNQEASNLIIHNNMISDIHCYQRAQEDGWPLGIRISGTTGGIKIYHNSINLFGSHTGHATTLFDGGGVAPCIHLNSTGPNIDIRNNLLTNSYTNPTSASDKSYTICATTTMNTQFNPAVDYNDYFVSGPSGVLGRINGIDRFTLAEMQSGFGGNINSVNISPVYISNTDLHLPPASNVAIDNLGTAIQGIYTDVDVQPRNILTPDIGADEFSNGCSTKVTSLADSGAGSLRDVIACAVDGDPVTFDASLMGQTITLTSGEININKHISIFGPGTFSDLNISGGGTSRIFNVAATKQLHLHSLSLRDGYSLSDGGALYLQGSLLLRNVLFQDNLENISNKALTIKPGSTMTIAGEVDVEQ